MLNNTRLFGTSLILFTGVNLVLASFCILFNLDIKGYLFVLSFFIVCGLLFFFLKKNEEKYVKKFFLLTGLLFLTIAICSFISGKIYDFSWDGQTYHQEAVLQLHSGWNPLYDEDLDEGPTEHLHADYRSNFWINHYAKGNWYLAAISYDLFGSIEYGKVFQLLTMLSTFLISFSFVYSLLEKKLMSLIIGVIIVLNPVSWNQIFTFYNDGYLYLTFVLVIIYSIEWLQKKDILTLLALCLSIILMVNTKFTALGYAIIACGIPLFIIMYNNKGNLKNIFSKKYLKLYLSVIAAFIFAVAITGSASYVKNFIDHKHPFYPLAGEGKVDIMSYNTPEPFKNLSTVEQFYLSLFSKTTNNRKAALENKIPFTVTGDEIKESIKVDTRVAGFGPLFSGVIILVILALAKNTHLLFNRKNIYYGIVFGILLLSVVINPEPWWARYIPQFWLIPVVILVLLAANYFKQNKWILYVTLTVFLLNGLLISGNSFKNTLENQNKIEKQLEILQEYSKNEEIAIYFETFLSNRNRLEENGVKFKKIDDLEEYEYKVNLVSSTTKICTNDKQLYEELKNAIR